MSKNKKLIVIVGPTGSGKTHKAIECALKLDAEIFSCDSRQLYSELNIGVARPSLEELSTVHHHFIASHTIHDQVDAGRYEEEAIAALSRYYLKKDVAILCGGTGFYADAVINGMDAFPDIDPSIILELEDELNTKGLAKLQEELLIHDALTYHNIDLNNSRRVLRALSVIRQTGLPFHSFKTGGKKAREFSTEVIYINPERTILYDHINKRVDHMISIGLIDEARSLFPFQSIKPLQTVGYSELFSHFNGEINYTDAVEKIKQNSRNYAKRQVTLFNKKIELWKI